MTITWNSQVISGVHFLIEVCDKVYCWWVRNSGSGTLYCL